jgi:CheY-like chemotaxis protein
MDTLEAGNHCASETDYVGVAPRVGRPRVLLVDGDRSVRRMCSRHLRLKGLEVMEAADGRSGLEQARLEPPDLILSGVRMPGLDGFALVEALRGDERTRDVPIVFLSGDPDPADRMRAWRIGLAGFVAKPFEPAALATLLAGVIERNAAPDGHVLH